MKSNFANLRNGRGYSQAWKKVTIAAIIAIIIASFVVTSIFQQSAEARVRNAIFEHEREKQTAMVESLSQHISSDMLSMTLRLKGLANSPPFQQGQFASPEAKQLLEESYSDVKGIIDRLGVIGADGLTKVNLVPAGEDDRVKNQSATASIVFQNVKQTLAPHYSEGYMGMDGKYRIAIGYPVINRESGELLGALAVTMPTSAFFQRYGNIFDISNQYIAVIDRDGNYLATALPDFVGKNFYSDEIQEEIGHNENVNALIDSVVKDGKAYGVITDFGVGERLATGHPVIVDGTQAYSVFVVTPTTSIYSEINDVLFADRIQNYLMLGLVAAALIVIILVLIKWNSNLHRQVQTRTHELEQANLQLEDHDKMQREFINVAAHEIRTPVQPILGMTDILESQIENGKDNILVKKDELAIIARNAKRLERLTTDVLAVARIEGNSYKLNKTTFNLVTAIENVVEDVRKSLQSGTITGGQEQTAQVKISVINNAADKHLQVEADMEKIRQVMHNLIHNALKFSPPYGTITITLNSHAENGTKRYATVIVSDQGSGIDPEIMPRLFTKFASKSQNGTGLGLYISKSIIEAHGGTIWGQSNKDGRGAIFGFNLPILDSSTSVIED